jgi:hypothetical protein
MLVTSASRLHHGELVVSERSQQAGNLLKRTERLRVLYVTAWRTFNQNFTTWSLHDLHQFQFFLNHVGKRVTREAIGALYYPAAQKLKNTLGIMTTKRAFHLPFTSPSRSYPPDV